MNCCDLFSLQVLFNVSVLLSAGECILLHLNLIKEMNNFANRLFPTVSYAACTVPSYPSGQIGFCLCSRNPDTNFTQPLRRLDPALLDLKYYNPAVHAAAFVLPQFAQQVSVERVQASLNSKVKSVRPCFSGSRLKAQGEMSA